MKEEVMKTISTSVRGDILIDAPFEDVWRSIFEFQQWAPTVGHAELISGEWDKQGRVILITKKGESGMAPFYLETIKINHGRQIVNKIDTKEKSDPQCHGYVDISLSTVDSKTKVVYSNYLTRETAMSVEDLQGPSGTEGIKGVYLKPLRDYVEATYGKSE